MYVFGTVGASAAIRPCCGCSVLPGEEGTTTAGGGAGGTREAAGWVLPKRGGWVLARRSAVNDCSVTCSEALLRKVRGTIIQCE